MINITLENMAKFKYMMTAKTAIDYIEIKITNRTEVWKCMSLFNSKYYMSAFY
jgi:hypothetical protein